MLGSLRSLMAHSSAATEVFKHASAEWMSKKEREEIKSALASVVEPSDCEPNPEAIHWAGKALAAASESSKPKPAPRGSHAGSGPLRM